MILPALKKTYEIADGSITAICGQNGSGKSTLAKILAGIEKPDDGTVTSATAKSVGYLPQQSYAFHMSITSNLMLNKKKKRSLFVRVIRFIFGMIITAIILLFLSLALNIIVALVQGRFEK